MSDERKTRPRRGRQPKAAGASGSRQRSIKDMLGGQGSKETNSQVAQTQPVIDLAGVSNEETDVHSPNVETTVPITNLPPENVRTGMSTPKALYPIFRKPVDDNLLPPSSPLASEPEIIHITDDEPSSPKPSQPPKPLHPFFSRNATSKVDRSESSGVQTEEAFNEGSTRDDPIVIESSPLKHTTMLPKLAKLAHPFFSTPRRAEAQSSPQLPSATFPLPYPDRESQHVTGPQGGLPIFNEAFSRKNRSLNAHLSSEDFTIPRSDVQLGWLRSQDPPFPSCDSIPLAFSKAHIHTLSAYIDTIPRLHQSHPSIARLLQYADTRIREETDSTLPQQDQWIDRWRPTCAEEVIGNEENASYLRHWMDALRLKHEQRSDPLETAKYKGSKKRKRVKSKRRDIVRHIKKRRRDDYEEDFVVTSDFTDEDDTLTMASSDFDDFAFCQDMVDRMSATSLPEDSLRSSPGYDILSDASEVPHAPLKAPRFGQQIRNTILLVGPSGSGKTAAVYACASELGWDVFEVYPGIGERSGTELNKLIGDVGKNHIVKVQHQPSPTKGNLKAAFFQAGQGKPKVAQRVESEDEGNIDIISVSPPAGIEDADADSTEPTVNQSVVLIEEVDILYQTDVNFWPALINIIKECRRPVILTCNDILRVPCLDLPLQTTLHFTPCPAPLAGSYLQALCLAQDVEIGRKVVIHLYEDAGVEDGRVTFETRLPDLRQTIMQLQFLVTNVKAHATASAPYTFPAVPLSVATVQEVPAGSGGSPSLVDDSTTSVPTDQSRETAVLLAEMCKVWDSLSLADSQLCRENNVHLWNVFADESAPSSDDPLGYKVLHAQANTDYCPISAFYQQDENMYGEALRLTQRVAPEVFAEHIPTPSTTRSIDVARMRYRALLEPLLRNPISDAPTRACRVSTSQQALYLDYAPWIRYIVAADDALESASQPSSQGRRSTRNSLKTSQDRWLKLEVDQRRTLSETSLRLDSEEYSSND